MSHSRMMSRRVVSSNQRGFSLVELAVVIVIIGALVVGVVAGGKLIDVAEVQAAISEIEQNQSAISSFRTKYYELPGDMSDAEDYWTVGATDNGNGDGRTPWGGATNEGALAWQHLELAGFAQYGGMAGTGSDAVINSNVPVSNFKGGYFLDYSAAMGNHMGLGKQEASGINDGALLTPREGYEIDIKLDDGLSTSGKVQSTGGSCATAGEYNYTTQTPECVLLVTLNAGD